MSTILPKPSHARKKPAPALLQCNLSCDRLKGNANMVLKVGGPKSGNRYTETGRKMLQKKVSSYGVASQVPLW